MDYDQEKYKIWKLPNPLLLHWIINPGLAINEVFLGQRIPKVSLIDKTSKAPLVQRTFIPCPSCSVIHDGRLWASGNSFGHWLGYICPNCTHKIPCLWNLTSLLLLALLSPIWLPIKYFYEKKYIAYELTRYKKQTAVLNKPLTKYVWLKIGLAFGAFIFLFTVVQNYFNNTISVESLGVMAVISVIAGLLFGVLMWFCVGRSKK